VVYPEACSIQDVDGRAPLHFACDEFCKLFEGDDNDNRSSTLTLRPTTATTTTITEGLCPEKVQVLLLGSLESVMLEDEDEMNALEYASMRSFRCVTKRDATGEENYKEGGKSVFDTPICFRSR
jgi:hypothetical protein